MGYIDDPTGKRELADLKRRIAALEAASPLKSASITEGRLRVGGTAILLVDSDGGIVVQGSIDVTGTMEVSGTLNGDGTITWTGPVNLDGATNVRGDLSVLGGGKFIAGDVQIGPALGGGGGGIESTGGPLYLTSNVEVQMTDAKVVGDMHVTGGIRSSTMLPTSNAANVYADANGLLWRVT